MTLARSRIGTDNNLMFNDDKNKSDVEMLVTLYTAAGSKLV